MLPRRQAPFGRSESSTILDCKGLIASGGQFRRESHVRVVAKRDVIRDRKADADFVREFHRRKKES